MHCFSSVAPTLLLYFPAEQFVHFPTVFKLPFHDPRGQSTHSLDTWCLFSINSPASHEIHVFNDGALEITECFPVGHSRQFETEDEARVDEYLPMPQSTQNSEEFAVNVVEYVPKGHSTQSDTDDAAVSFENVPPDCVGWI